MHVIHECSNLLFYKKAPIVKHNMSVVVSVIM